MIYIYFVLMQFFCCILAVFVHDVGHWLFGLFYGYEFKIIFWGPFILWKNSGSVNFRFNRRLLHLLFVPGSIDLQIKNIEKFSKKGYIMMLLGGPVTSLFVSMIAFITMSYKYNLVILCFGLMIFVLGLSSLIPSKRRRGSHYTDGKRVLELIKDDRHGNNEYNTMFVYQCETHNLWQEKEQEISEKLSYIINHPLDFDNIYTIFALSRILRKNLDILEKEDVLQRMNDFSLKGTPDEKDLIDRFMNEEITWMNVF